MASRQTLGTLAIGALATVTLQQGISHYARFSPVPDLDSSRAATQDSSVQVDAKWYPPKASRLNNLDTVLSSTGVYGYQFDSSNLPNGIDYGTYNHANMPHVRPAEYPAADPEYRLRYVEVIHRHHKRTPYDHNCFPQESYAWHCDDEALISRGTPRPDSTTTPPHEDTVNRTADTFWTIYSDPINPFRAPGFNGTCTFPQLTRGGLDDSWQHGRDLFATYSAHLGFLAATHNASLEFRVTNNPITSQVAGMLIAGMFPGLVNTDTGLAVPLRLQDGVTDSLEPRYACRVATALYDDFGYGSRDPVWTEHLRRSQPLYDALDAVSGVSAAGATVERDWTASWDHYFDNLAMRLAHGKDLPCKIGDDTRCVSRAQADEVFRLGIWEYDFIYRSAGQRSLDAAVASYGVWIAELAHNLRNIGQVVYRHNVAHDGSMARLLAILQIEQMVWPGMGSEVIFEVYDKADDKFLRILWGGQVLRSSSPALGVVDMVPLERVLAYFDELVGRDASKIVDKCR